MRLVEVVVLVGSQCVSPLQHAPNHTVAFQVPCAVLIQRDEASGRIGVTPSAQVANPRVVRALKRFGGGEGAEVAATPPPDAAAAPQVPLTPPAPETVPPAAVVALPPANIGEQVAMQPEETEAPAAEPPDDAGEPVATGDEGSDDAASAEPEPEKKPAPKASAGSKKKAKSKRSSQCRGKTTPKWYTNAQGRRKYRCVAGGSLPVY